jgi:uncharacterized membrane protein
MATGNSNLREVAFYNILFPSGWLGGSLVYKHGMGVEPATARAERRARVA